jgi:hypothetical protein
VDHWAKNKRMFWFPDMSFIFNLHRKTIFLLHILDTHMLYIKCLGYECAYSRKETPYLEYLLFVHGSESPSLLVPCSKPICPILKPNSLCCPLLANMIFIYIRMTLARRILLLSGTFSLSLPPPILRFMPAAFKVTVFVPHGEGTISSYQIWHGWIGLYCDLIHGGLKIKFVLKIILEILMGHWSSFFKQTTLEAS